MSMRQALIEAREYIADDLREIVDNTSIDHTRATVDDDALPWVEKADIVLDKIDAALSEPPTDPECAAALDVWFSDFAGTAREQMSRNVILIDRMRRALIAARGVGDVA